MTLDVSTCSTTESFLPDGLELSYRRTLIIEPHMDVRGESVFIAQAKRANNQSSHNSRHETTNNSDKKLQILPVQTVVGVRFLSDRTGTDSKQSTETHRDKKYPHMIFINARLHGQMRHP